MKKLFAATLLTMLLAVNLSATNVTLNVGYEVCIPYGPVPSGVGAEVVLNAIWTDHSLQCPNHDYSGEFNNGSSYNGGTITGVQCVANKTAFLNVHKTTPTNCDCIDTVTILDTMQDSLPSCTALNPYGLSKKETCN